MKDYKGMLKKVMLLLALLLLFSCATTQQIQHVSEGQIIDVVSYSVVTPSGEWNVEIDKGRGIVTFVKAKQELLGVLTGVPQGGTIIKVLRNAVTRERWHLTEEEVADEVRDLEEKNMIEMGVNKDEYKLEDVTKGITTVGEKKLYCMSYKTTPGPKGPRPPFRQVAILYLYFPADFEKKHVFYEFLISEASGLLTSLKKPDLTQIESVINSFQISLTPRLSIFNFDRRLDIYETIDSLSTQLLNTPGDTILKKKETKTFDKFPNLVLIDKDGDGIADEFAYYPIEGKDTREFGFMFDLNNDGKVDYIVFNGGPIFTKDIKFFWMNYHWIDSNYDGKIDIMVYNDIDLDGDKFPDKGITAWIYDIDFIGTIDKGEYLGKGFEKSIQKLDGVFTIKRSTGETTIQPEREIFIFPNMLLSDINSMLP